MYSHQSLSAKIFPYIKRKKKNTFKKAVTDIGQILCVYDYNKHSDLGSIRILLTTKRRQSSSLKMH